MFKNNMAKLSDKLTSKFGDTITLVEIITNNDDYDPLTGEIPSEEIHHIVKGLVEEYTTSPLVVGLIEINDLKVTVSSRDMNITKKWEVIANNSRCEIISISEVSTQDKKIYYELQIRSR